jgi:regulator of sigma E protease
MHEFLVSVVAFIVLVGVMVVVHEFGHFAVAKLCGVRVESFSVGFGPRLFGVKLGETDYKVCVLPLGGYVKMTGETPDQITTTSGEVDHAELVHDPGAFTTHPRWQRMLIGVAGPIANFILAFLLMLAYYGLINEVPKHEVKTANVEWVVPNSPAAQAGLQPGDVIRHFDGVDNPDWNQVAQHADLNPGQSVPMTVQRGDQSLALTLHEPPPVKNHDFDFDDVGIIPQFVPGPIGVQDVSPGLPAEQAGLRAGDAIQAVDGYQFHTVQALLAYMQANPGKPVTLTVLRGGAVQPPIVVHPVKLDSTGYKLGFLQTAVPFGPSPLPLDAASKKSFKFCQDNSSLIVEVLGRIVTRHQPQPGHHQPAPVPHPRRRPDPAPHG